MDQLVGIVGSIAELRGVPLVNYELIHVLGYYTAGDGAGGLFYPTPASPPGTYADNGATIIVPIGADGSRAWARSSASGLDITHFGASTSLANNSPFVQAMFNLLGYFSLPLGTFPCVDQINFPPGASPQGATFRGVSRERSVLRAVGMAGKKLVYADGSASRRFAMYDLTLDGDADTALYIDTNVTFFYNSIIQNCAFKGVAGPGLYIGSMFSAELVSVHGYSTSSDTFNIRGGPAVALRGCYAHSCGPTSAGYRIEGAASLYSCNGVDQPGAAHVWGHFGSSARPSFYNVALVGCNIEDFGEAGIKLEYGGRLTVDNTTFLAPATGAFLSFIKCVGATSHNIYLGNGATHSSKGAAMTCPDPIYTEIGLSSLVVVGNTVSGAPPSQWAKYRVNNVSISYESGTFTFQKDEYAHASAYFPRLHSGRFIGYSKPLTVTLGANVTTAAVVGVNQAKTNNSVPTSLAGFTGGEDGQSLTILVNDANTTLLHAAGGAGQFILAGATNKVTALDQVYSFVYKNGAWRQTSGSA